MDDELRERLRLHVRKHPLETAYCLTVRDAQAVGSSLTPREFLIAAGACFTVADRAWLATLGIRADTEASDAWRRERRWQGRAEG